MNHYERLKVARDAPAEVIRAAYRALATKLHPDRQGSATGPDHASHALMAALNTAYEVLIDPKLRGEYDATLSVGAAVQGDAPSQARPAFETADVASLSRIDLDWLTPRDNLKRPFWPPSRLVLFSSVAVLTALVLGAASIAWHVATQQQMDRALSQQYAEHPLPEARGDDKPLAAMPPPRPVATRPPATSPMPAENLALAGARPTPGTMPDALLAAGRKPTVQELSRMSDEELLKVLPTLDTEPPTARTTPTRSKGTLVSVQPSPPTFHVLDGKPLSLRNESHLVDPLASDAASRTP